MTVHLYWWLGPLALFIVPPIAVSLRRWSMYDFLPHVIVALCWTSAITWLLVRWLS